MDTRTSSLFYPSSDDDPACFPRQNWDSFGKDPPNENSVGELKPVRSSNGTKFREDLSYFTMASNVSRHDFPILPASAWTNEEPFVNNQDISIFSSSFPGLFHEKCSLSDRDPFNTLEIATSNCNRVGEEALGSMEELESYAIGTLLPDDDEDLFSGVTNDLDYSAYLNTAEEVEDFDVFSSGGGMELESEPQDGLVACMNSRCSGVDLASQNGKHGTLGSVAGEHPYGEHPSRTLFVRNINSNVEDSELRSLFEQYGAIRTLYTACKHRGFVMISYYDIRAARSAMRALQNKPLRRRKLDIHFSIPKDNPSDKDVNQGTLVVFNLDVSVTTDDLRRIFGAYGEVKEIRETPHKRHHKFIEFYDVRSAEAALRALNRSDIAGKRIKLEPSRPGGARRSLMQQLSQELEQEERRAHCEQVHSLLNNSPSAHLPQYPSLKKSPDTGVYQSFPQCVPPSTIVNAITNQPVNERTGTMFSHISSLATMRDGGDHVHQTNQIEKTFHGPVNYSTQPSITFPQAHSLPEFVNGLTSSGHFNNIPSSNFPKARKQVEMNQLQRAASSTPNDSSMFTHRVGVGIGIPQASSALYSGPLNPGNVPISNQQLIWGNSNPFTQQARISPPIMWPDALTQSHNHTAQVQAQKLASVGRMGHPSENQNVGSAPSGEPTIIRKNGYVGDLANSSSIVVSGSMGLLGPTSRHTLPLRSSPGNFGLRTTTYGNKGYLPPSPNVGMIPPQHRVRVFSNTGLPMSALASADAMTERGRNRRPDVSFQADNRKQYQLDLDRILRKEDSRTTLMIKNIPNKYTSKMLLAAIDELHHGTYDFIYLPIDFKNKCNVGYAFINMIDTSSIVRFYQAFNGKRWEKFNSEKVASLAYARIQGKAALVAHFQNSSLMNEDKRCRPILFHSEGPNMGDQEPFPVGINIRTRPNRDPSSNGGTHNGSPTSSNSSKDDTLLDAGCEFLEGATQFSLEKEGLA